MNNYALLIFPVMEGTYAVQSVFLYFMFFLLQTGGISWLEQSDRWLFVKLNRDWINPLFDIVMPFTRNGLHWVPVYLFLAVFVLVNFRVRGGWWMLFFSATAALTDMTGTNLFKHVFHRLRPCADPDFASGVRLLLDRCAGGYSFTSNHAANHFGMATFIATTLYPVAGRWTSLAYAWAAWIAYAQVYVGVHYPLDVLGGALLGLVVGYATGRLFNKRFGFAIFDHQPGA